MVDTQTQAEIVAARNYHMDKLLRLSSVKTGIRTSHPPTKTTIPTADPRPLKITVQKQPEKTSLAQEIPQIRHINGVSPEVYDYFGMQPGLADFDQIKRMQYVQDWVLKNDMRKLNKLDIRLGSADAGEAKLLKIYNWLRVGSGHTRT